MKIISHRGSLNGPDSTLENDPIAILAALNAGFWCEADVWLTKDGWMTGHDRPHYPALWTQINKSGLFLHCKNIEAYSWLAENETNIRPDFFWHQQDDYTLTSNKFIWTYPGRPLPEKGGIAVLPERFPEWDISNAFAICTDYPVKYVRI